MKKTRKKKTPRKKPEVSSAQQLEALKRLMMLQLIASGVQAADIAKVLGTSKSVVSGVIPVRSLLLAKRPKERGDSH